MKLRIALALISAFIGAGALSASAYAADVYERGSTKDSPAPTEYVSAVSRSGWYLTGELGWAQIDRSARTTINGQKNKLGSCDPEVEEGEDCFEQDDELKAGQIAGPLVFSDVLGNSGQDDQSALVYGGMLSYMLHMPTQRFGLEFGIGGTIYADNESTMAIAGRPTITALGDGCPACIYDDVGDPNRFSNQLGQVKFERDFDIDLVAKGHLFVNPSLSLYAGAGLSIARASAVGAHVSDYSIGGKAEGAFDNAFKDSDTSLGYVLLAGFQWWATDRIVIGGEYSYKQHEFEFGGGSSVDAVVAGDAYRYSVSDKIDVEEDVHTVKVRAGFKLN